MAIAVIINKQKSYIQAAVVCEVLYRDVDVQLTDIRQPSQPKPGTCFEAAKVCQTVPSCKCITSTYQKGRSEAATYTIPLSRR